MRLAIVLLTASIATAADAPPEWVLQASRATTLTYPSTVQAVTLLREEVLTVDAEGNRTARERGVIKILQTTRSRISALRSYNTKSGRIKSFQGWLIAPDGKTTTYGKDHVLDISLADGMYDEARAKSLPCPVGSAPGTIFAYEAVEEEKTIFTHYRYSVQDDGPAVLSRFVLRLPAGWEAKGTVLNQAGPQHAQTADGLVWEWKDLPTNEEEEYGPERYSLTPQLAIAYFPTGENRAGLRPLKDWSAVSAWVADFMDPAAAPNTSIAAKSMELVRGASSELDKIRAIAAYVQKTVYVSVQMNLTRGGGYTPNSADKVLTRNYGDCKDKVALMRALLAAAGIQSHAVAIYSGNSRFVQPAWASPLQFNHAIVAVRVSKDVDVPTVIEHPKLGRLLFFDTTAEWTPLGDLPQSQQASWALVIAGTSGELVKAPALPAAANAVETTIEAVLNLDGSAKGALQRRWNGAGAASMRSLHHDQPDGMKRVFETALARRLGGSAVTKVEAADAADRSHFDAKVGFTVAQFGQLMQDRLLLLRPGALAASTDYGFTLKERRSPVLLRPRVRHDKARVKVPDGFAVDELPDPVELKSRYATYRAKWAVDGATVSFEQSLEVPDSVVPVEEYATLRQLFENISGAQHATVVLIRK